MTLPPQWEKDALALVEQASPLEGQFFRSVELAYGHPDDVISGEGTRDGCERAARMRGSGGRNRQGDGHDPGGAEHT